MQSILKKKLQSNDIYFIEDNCTTSVQLTTQVETRCKEVDAVVIYSYAMNMDIIREYVEELRVYTENLRVVLILNGPRKSFLRNQINDYWDMKLDLIFEDDGFDSDELVGILRKGKLSNKDFRERRRETGFIGDIDDIPPPEDYAKPFVPIVTEYMLVYHKDDPFLVSYSKRLGNSVDISQKDVAGLTWHHLIRATIEKLGGEAKLTDLYDYLSEHPKAKNNEHYKERIRATIYEHKEQYIPTGSGSYRLTYMVA